METQSKASRARPVEHLSTSALTAASLVLLIATLAGPASAQSAAPATDETLPPAPAPSEPPAPPPAPAGAPTEPAAVRPQPSSTPVKAATPAPRDEYTGPPLLIAPAIGKPKVGGYGGMTVAYTRMLHRDGVLVGGEGAALLDHRLSLGGAGYGFSRTPGGPPAADGSARHYVAGYGGLVIRYAIFTDIPLYASFGVLVGGGAITLAPEHHQHEHEEDVEARGFFVFQPDASLHVNATRWLRFSLTAGYRVATSVDRFHYQADDVGGAVLGGNIQAGWF